MSDLNPNVERLTRLADLLEALPQENRFNLSIFQHVGVKSEHHCGTCACAIGYAALDPWFNAQGLTTQAVVKTDRRGETIEVKRIQSATLAEFVALEEHCTAGTWVETDVAVDGDIYKPAHHFFGIDSNFFDLHFTHQGYPNNCDPTALEVAAKLRASISTTSSP